MSSNAEVPSSASATTSTDSLPASARAKAIAKQQVVVADHHSHLAGFDFGHAQSLKACPPIGGQRFIHRRVRLADTRGRPRGG